jgi:zinc/manganese transport system substrate-binding protein
VPVATRTHRRRPLAASVAGVLSLLVVGTLVAACGSGGSSADAGGGSAGRVVQVVAAENFWGSIAAQIGGRHAHVRSIVVNPATDPHSYEPIPADARALAGAQLVVANGIGYDPWVPKLLAADGGGRTVLDVGRLVGVPEGGNPHRWYQPVDVHLVASRVVLALQRLDPPDAAYFGARGTAFEGEGLSRYHQLIGAIKAKFAGTPVGASESIFAMLSPALGLDLITPPSFLKAVSEGTDMSAADKATIDDQITHHRIRIYVYNRQNVTPDVQVQLAEVRTAHIPVATITETLVPATATFEAWQVQQLSGIESALAAASP